MWDQNYDRPDYLFGTEPAAFLPRVAHLLPAQARILSLAEGEGRNGVWLAGQGHAVTGLDLSSVGLAKAARLAEARGVPLELHLGYIAQWDGTDGPWDAVLAVFVHFRAEEWPRLAAALTRGLRPGGLFLYHGYHPDQIAHGTGGPRDPSMLWPAAGVAAHFPGWQAEVLCDHAQVLAEGSRHVGQSALVDVVLRAPQGGLLRAPGVAKPAAAG